MKPNPFTQQTTVHLPFWMHDGLKELAAKRYQSLHGLMLVALHEWLESKGIKEPAPADPFPQP